MSEMPEYVLKELASKAVGEMVTALEQKARELDAAYEEIETLRAEIERLNALVQNREKALEQACDRANLVAASDTDEGYCELNQHLPVWEHRHKELAAYLRERDSCTGGDS